MKTSMSRFQIHDDLTAPEGSVPVLRGALATGGQLPNFLGVLAGSPAPEAARKAMAERQLDGRMGTPEEIAAAVSFVASDKGRFINGAALVIDGGMTAV